MKTSFSRISNVLAFLIIAGGVALALFTILQKSPTVDESVHLSSGYSYLVTSDFRMNPEHPPLVKEIAAFPLLFMGLESKTDGQYFSQSELWNFGPDFVYHNVMNGNQIVTAGRIPMLIFFALLGLVVYVWAKRLYGEKTALVVLFFTMLSVTILGHAGLVTTDVPITFAFLLVCYTMTKFLKEPRKYMFQFTLALALVLLIKYTAVVAGAIIFVIFLLHSLLHARGKEKDAVSRFASDFFERKFVLGLVALAGTLVIILFVYHGNFQTAYTGVDTRETIVEFISDKPQAVQDTVNWIGNNVKFPAYYYWEGMVSVLTHNKGGHDSFLLGEATNQGWWYYFPVLFLLKSSLATLILTFGVAVTVLYKSIIPIFRAKQKRLAAFVSNLKAVRFDYIVLVVAPVLFMLISMQSNLNLGVRHVLPVYPFVFLLAGAFLKYFVEKKWLRPLLVALMAFALYTTLSVFPNYLAYYNPLSGGVVNAKNIAVDSNLDWGQDLSTLSRYMKANNIPSVALYYFGTARPESYGIEFSSVPSTSQIKKGLDVKGYVVVSATLLANPGDEIEWLLLYQPIERLGGSLYVYYFD